MNILISKSYLKYIFIVCLPWLLASSGGFIHIDLPIQALLILILTFITIYYLSYTVSKKTNKVTPLIYEEKNFLNSKLVFYSLIGILSLVMTNIYALSSSYDFNMAFVRSAIFNDEKGVEHVYGSLLKRMLYTYMFLPTVFISLLDVYKFKLKHLIISLLYILCGVLVGGRFALYHVFIIYIINSMFNKQKIFSFKNFFLILFFLGISLYVIINRRLSTGSLLQGLMDSIGNLFLGIYNYHSVQLGIMSFYEELTVMPLGPFTGISTPLSFIFSGGGTIEGNMLTFLHSIEFVSPIGKIEGYNAFGTSIMYFLPIFGWTGILAFFLCVFISFYLFSSVKNIRTRILLFKYMLFSLFFSAFSPMMFSFAWWFGILFIFLIKKQNSNVNNYSNS